MYEISRIGKFLETESKLKLPVLGEGRNGELLNGYRVSVWGDENTFEIDSGHTCTTP